MDGEITNFPNYIDDINIITDKTEETRKIVNQVPFTNIVLDLETRNYVLNKQSKFKLVIESIIDNMNSKPYMRNLIYSIGGEQISDYVKNKNRNPSTYVNYNRNYLFTDENFKNVYVSDEIVRKVYG